MAFTASVTTKPADGTTISGTVQFVVSGTEIRNAEIVGVGAFTPKYATFTINGAETTATLAFNTATRPNGTFSYDIVVFDQPAFSPNPTQLIRFGPFTNTIQNQTAATERGPLVVNPNNFRFFAHKNETSVPKYLVGSHTWPLFQDWGTGPGLGGAPYLFNYTAFLDFLESFDHNFFRGWTYSVWGATGATALVSSPSIWARPGPGLAADGQPKWDLNLLNASFINRMKTRIQLARDRGIYCSVMLFNNWDVRDNGSVDPYPRHPFNSNNNINGISAGANGNTVHTTSAPASIRAVQNAYIDWMVDNLNEYDNIIWEIMNEGENFETAGHQWQYDVISRIRNREATLPNQHLIGMSGFRGTGTTQPILDSQADYTMFGDGGETGGNACFNDNYPANNYGRPNFADTDHFGYPQLQDGAPIESYMNAGTRLGFAWRMFTRGHMPLLMEDFGRNIDMVSPPASWNEIRSTIGQTATYASAMFDLAAMTPQNSLSSTTFCLASVGNEYIVLKNSTTSSSFTVTVATGTYFVEWLRLSDGTVTPTAQLVRTTTGSQSFTSPYGSVQSVLYLRNVTLGTSTMANKLLSAQPELNTVSDQTGNQYELYVERKTPSRAAFRMNLLKFRGDKSVIKNFGAVGDGTTDDTAALQAALTWSANSGGVVRLDDGFRFRITSGLQLLLTGNRDAPWGFDGAAEIIADYNNANVAAIHIESRGFRERLHLANFSIRGTRFEGKSQLAAIYLSAPNLQFNGSSLHQNHIDNVRCYHMGGDALRIRGDVFESQILGFCARTSSGNGISIIEDNTGNPSSLDICNANIAKCTYGIYVEIERDVRIINGHFLENAKNGMFFNNGNQPTLVNCGFENNCTAGGTNAAGVTADSHIFCGNNEINITGGGSGNNLSAASACRFHVRAHVTRPCFISGVEQLNTSSVNPALLAINASGNGFVYLVGCIGNVARVGGNSGTYRADFCTGFAHDGSAMSFNGSTGNK